jgi:hypothetical protein
MFDRLSGSNVLLRGERGDKVASGAFLRDGEVDVEANGAVSLALFDQYSMAPRVAVTRSTDP